MNTRQSIITIIAIILLIGWAGRYDRAEEVLESISIELYHQIREDIGGRPSDVVVADTYLAHKDRYDSLSIANGWTAY